MFAINGYFCCSYASITYETSYGNIVLPDEFDNYHNIVIFEVDFYGETKYKLFISNTELVFDYIDFDKRSLSITGSPTFYQNNSSLSRSTLFSNTMLDFSRFSACSGITTGFKGIYFSNYDLRTIDGSICYPSDVVNNPSFITTQEELSSGKFDTLKISAGNLNGFSDEFGLVLFDVTSGMLKLKPIKTFVLNYYSDYCDNSNSDIIYYIPKSDLGIDLSNGKKYMFTLSTLDGSEIYNSVTFEVGNLTTEEEMKNKQDLTNSKIDEQTNAIKEQNETNKNIFEKIGEMLSYINPFSENFFVYKLIELLVDAIKSLFIPSDDFFDSYFTDLKDWFSDRLGFLFYPFEIVIDILTKILSINFANPVFNIPDLYEPFTNSKLMSATTFNLNSLVQSGALKTIHDIYLVCVDAFIIFELVNLFRRKYEEVTTK